MGAFAIQTQDGTHVVTHTQTGRTVCEVKGKRKAINLARQLDRLLPEGDFTAEDFETEKYKTFVQQAKPVIDAARAAL
jgi:hypothetical protein